MEKIKKIRELTGAGVMDVKKALDKARGDEKKALEILKARGIEKAEKKSERATSQGIIDCYIHLGKIGCMIEVNCETDFVARNEDFKKFVHELALQVASSEAKDIETLLDEPYFREPEKKIKDLLRGAVTKTGENIKIKRFVKYILGE
jgi:elongation factor Ts